MAAAVFYIQGLRVVCKRRRKLKRATEETEHGSITQQKQGVTQERRRGAAWAVDIDFKPNDQNWGRRLWMARSVMDGTERDLETNRTRTGEETEKANRRGTRDEDQNGRVGALGCGGN